MDFGRAFSYVFNDPDWIKKVLIGGLLGLVPIVNFMTLGYSLEVTKNVFEGHDEPMPEWHDFGGYLVRGLLIFVGQFIWLIPLWIVLGCLFAVVAVAASINDALGFITGLGSFCLGFIVAIVWGAALIPIVTGRYAVERKFESMFQFSEIIDEAKRAGTSLLLLLLVAIVAGFVSWLGLIVCLIGVIFTSFYAQIVVGHATGQVYRIARDIDTTSEQPAF